LKKFEGSLGWFCKTGPGFVSSSYVFVLFKLLEEFGGNWGCPVLGYHAIGKEISSSCCCPLNEK
jgi:hypothetical protein